MGDERQQPEPDRPRHADRDSRRPIALNALATLKDGSVQKVSLVDLSYDGCRIQTPVQLQVADPIRLSVAGRGEIDAEVRWYSEGQAGLVFRAEPEARPDDRGTRDSTRIPIGAEAGIKRIGRSSFNVRVTDASPNGVRFEFVDRPEVGEPVLVKFDGIHPLEGKVQWVEGIEAGVYFEQPIHGAVFDLLLERYRQKP